MIVPAPLFQGPNKAQCSEPTLAMQQPVRDDALHGKITDMAAYEQGA